MNTELRIYEKIRGGMELVAAVKQANGYWSLGIDEPYVKEDNLQDRLRGYVLVYTQIFKCSDNGQ